jgi:peptidoglycan/LPS O-acetylase OafA/YrhL
MARNEKTDFQRRYIPSIEGIRGYGFLVVFFAHFFGPEQFATSGRIFFYPSLIESAIGTFAVPGFFVVSGYLIGGILYDSRGKEGFFKVFYSRRILRVFPLYYLTLLAITFLDMFRGVPLDYHFWAHFIYLQNLLPGYATQHGPPTIQVIHFWSLAVEEQFYFLWPLVVLAFPRASQAAWNYVGSHRHEFYFAYCLSMAPSVKRASLPLHSDTGRRYSAGGGACDYPP